LDINGIKSRGKLSKNQKHYYPLDWNFLLQEQTGQFQCSYCGIFLPQKEITEDHIYPRSLGGSVITSACNNCNQLKGNKLPIDWAVFSYEYNIDLGAGDSNVKKNPKKSKKSKKEFNPWIAHPGLRENKGII